MAMNCLIAVAAARIQGRPDTQQRENRQPKPRPPVTTIVVIPTIQFGDRARE